ncbi:MAG: hypothetical protein ACHQO8_13385 [Vicinamibacterales bacterium]
MITSLQAPLAFVGPSGSLAPVRQRCPFLHEVGAAQPASTQRMRPPVSIWPPDADARANEVLHAFRRTGGLVSGDELTLMMRRRTSQPISMLARWIVERRVVNFGRQGEYLLPMFQFDQADMGVRRSVSAVLDEIDGTFDDWDLASWFALPNAWLGDAAPVDVLPRDPHAVLQAARADRFIARG